MASDGELITKLGGRCEAQAAAAAHDDDDDDYDDDDDDDDSVTRLSEFWKFLTTNFLTKVGQIIGNWKGYIVKHHLVCKTAEISFWAYFGLLFIPTSGHTGRRGRWWWWHHVWHAFTFFKKTILNFFRSTQTIYFFPSVGGHLNSQEIGRG